MLRSAIQRARDRLVAAGIGASEAGFDAELLARDTLGWDRATLVARLGDEAPGGFREAYETVIARRLRREPVAYIIGRQEFWGRDFHVRPGVLIPRPETELIVEETIAWARDRAGAPRIVDIGTGSGCLAITLALELPHATIEATEIMADALTIARENADRLGAPVAFHAGSMLAGVTPPVDAIVSNPPYITRADYERLEPEVRRYEPAAALVAGDDGLDGVRLVADAASRALAEGGLLVVEIGMGQAESAARIVAETERLRVLRVRHDLQGIPRTLIAERVPRPAAADSVAAGSALSDWE